MEYVFEKEVYTDTLDYGVIFINDMDEAAAEIEKMIEAYGFGYMNYTQEMADFCRSECYENGMPASMKPVLIIAHKYCYDAESAKELLMRQENGKLIIDGTNYADVQKQEDAELHRFYNQSGQIVDVGLDEIDESDLYDPNDD